MQKITRISLEIRWNKYANKWELWKKYFTDDKLYPLSYEDSLHLFDDLSFAIEFAREKFPGMHLSYNYQKEEQQR